MIQQAGEDGTEAALLSPSIDGRVIWGDVYLGNICLIRSLHYRALQVWGINNNDFSGDFIHGIVINLMGN